jgi:hypothetical protein
VRSNIGWAQLCSSEAPIKINSWYVQRDVCLAPSHSPHVCETLSPSIVREWDSLKSNLLPLTLLLPWMPAESRICCLLWTLGSVILDSGLCWKFRRTPIQIRRCSSAFCPLQNLGSQPAGQRRSALIPVLIGVIERDNKCFCDTQGPPNCAVKKDRFQTSHQASAK